MHPILGDRRNLAVYLLLWQLIGLLLTVTLRDDSWATAAAFFLPLVFVYAFVCLSAWYLCQAFPLQAGSRALRAAGVHIIAALIASVLWVIFAGFWAVGLDVLFQRLAAEALYGDRVLLLLAFGVLLFWLAAAGQYLLIAFEASRDAERRAIQLDLLAREAELRALRAQIDPHFIFNSLHSVSALTSSDPAAARRMCLLLADFLRETLRLGSNSRIPLGDELKLAERFLAIEQVRLGARLQVASEADPSAVDCLVPPLLLQPLVQNAVVHGIGQLVDGGTVRLAATRDGDTLVITLENPCDPDRRRTRGVGLGLELLRKRLATQCGTMHAVRAQEDDGAFLVEVKMPAVTQG